MEVQGELQVVRFEKERIGLVHQETLKDHRHMQLEQEKLRKKVRNSVYSVCVLGGGSVSTIQNGGGGLLVLLRGASVTTLCVGGAAESGIASYREQ